VIDYNRITEFLYCGQRSDRRGFLFDAQTLGFERGNDNAAHQKHLLLGRDSLSSIRSHWNVYHCHIFSLFGRECFMKKETKKLQALEIFEPLIPSLPACFFGVWTDIISLLIEMGQDAKYDEFIKNTGRVSV
jgi:hypothetical protein